jgi:hypothetical protein
MNAFGQELGSYESGYEFDATHIDTSLLVEDLITKTSHLFLCDNTPYDLSILDSIKFENLTSVWYPFNSYAQDYPVCYKLSNTEKAKIHKIMHKKTRDAIEACLKKLCPKYYFPHSADFVLNGPMSQSFENYKDNKYMDRELTAHTYSFSSLPNSISSYANYGDELEFLSNGNLKIHRDKFSYELVSSKPSLNNFQSVLKEKHSYLIEKAFSKMLQRCKKFKIDLSGASDWTIILNVDDYEDIFSYKELRLLREDEFLEKSKLLKIKLGKSQFDALMCRELHWNNAQIGYHLQFERIPNEYCQELYKSLNFFHL